MTDKPGQHFTPISDNSNSADKSSTNKIESASARVESAFKANTRENGDACGAYLQLRHEIENYERTQQPNANATKQFIAQISQKLEKDGYLAPIQIAGLRYNIEVSNYKPSNEKEQQSYNSIVAESKDPGARLFDQMLVAPIANQLKPENVLAALNQEKKRTAEEFAKDPYSFNQSSQKSDGLLNPPKSDSIPSNQPETPGPNASDSTPSNQPETPGPNASDSTPSNQPETPGPNASDSIPSNQPETPGPNTSDSTPGNQPETPKSDPIDTTPIIKMETPQDRKAE